MLVLDQESRFKIRSTKRLNSRGIAVIAGVVQSLESVQRYEMERRPARGKRTYTYASLIMMCMFIEMRHLTYDGDIAQNMLMAMGMPRGDGGYQRPSPARLSDFINNEWPEMEQAVSREYREAVLRILPQKIFTVDSTPMDANNYSKKYDFSPHYCKNMGKCHILMCCGYPMCRTFTNANDFDGNEYPKLLAQLEETVSGHVEMMTDGAYASFSNYAVTFQRFGVVMASNPRSGSVYHDDSSWERLLELYSHHWKEPSYRVKPENGWMLKYLISKGGNDMEHAGTFLRNLDMRRGGRIARGYASKRHVCETVHRSIKRWLRFDVRGLRRESEEQRKSFRFFCAQMLCTVFDPYYNPESD